MPSKFPWQRPQPAASTSTNSQGSPSNPYTNAYRDNRPIESSGLSTSRVPVSPAIGDLSVDSPSQLRARVNSPHNRVAVPDVFKNDNRAYPSPSAAAASGQKRGVSFLKRKKKDEDAPGQGWTQLAGDSPGPVRGSSMVTPVSGVKRYDARGYPERAGNEVGSPISGLSPETGKLGKYMLRTSTSRDSLASDVSSTGAGVNEESGRFLSSSNRPTSYIASHDTPGSVYPPVMDYSLSAPSYDPNHALNAAGYAWKSGSSQDHSNSYNTGPEPARSLYAQSMMSVQTRASDSSLTHFKKHDHLQDSYGAFSISSKGGTKHLGNNVSEN
jgi:hypothetical protein